MTPKEKAKELVEKFKWKVNPYVGSGMLSNTHDDEAILKRSKECAIICVDEILKSIKKHSDFTITYRKSKEYWQEVKTEIEKL